MRFLFVLDPLEKLNLKWDTSLAVLRELHRRGHQCFAADAPDFWAEGRKVWVRAAEVVPKFVGNAYRYIPSASKSYSVTQFKSIFIRKDPPFDTAYLYLTYVLELAAQKIPVINHPRGIRDTNEKLSVLEFPRWMPETVVASRPSQILEFQKKIKGDLVIKPLDQKGGEGVFLLKRRDSEKQSKLDKASQKGKKPLLAQRFLVNTFSPGEKRILLLDGKFAAVYEKRPCPGDFRANLSLAGATFHATALTKLERKLALEVGSVLHQRGIFFAGLDVLNEKLIEINVTSPAGVAEIMSLQPKTRLVEKVADFLESCAVRQWAEEGRAVRHFQARNLLQKELLPSPL